ncbi:tRNA (adenosine(37)-N6)-dimethylallyltransferase MiaA [Arthrobacter gandavensis]|uniref:tRNA dimethylallyltransferase n=1 Tax=Arthrobacter gandavensis TaxID=169960 RepID=A0ABP5AX62_9MICC|nr:tRNA (adenosine(37)-N6)-dimethylallyltransferase MiaA [Arthrobacter citreus]
MTGAALPVIAVVGPTGTGKSDLGVALARHLGGEVINADSMQFYRGMDIGTAKLPEAERGGIAHHLLDILDVTEEASVSAFQAQAREAINQIRSRGNCPILVGGSGLYVRAALDVLEFPGTDPQLRQQIEGDLEREGFEALRERLRAVDPVSAGRLGDARRVVRALEVHELTGRPFSSFMPDRTYHQPAIQLGLDVERPLLHERLALRVEMMVRQGLLEEVRALDAAGLRTGRTASRALGYAQFLKVLDGLWSSEQAVEDTVVATRQFARRQITWFRADPRVTWLDARDPDLLQRALTAILEK